MIKCYRRKVFYTEFAIIFYSKKKQCSIKYFRSCVGNNRPAVRVDPARARFGMKLFCVSPSDPALRAYIYNFVLYFRKDIIYNIYDMPESMPLSLSERIVVYLAQDLLCERREIILDNWYFIEISRIVDIEKYLRYWYYSFKQGFTKRTYRIIQKHN